MAAMAFAAALFITVRTPDVQPPMGGVYKESALLHYKGEKKFDRVFPKSNDRY
jgi:hypothetical protein